jgi:histidine ammonia-lyase
MSIIIDGHHLTIDEVVRVARELERATIADECYEVMKASRAVIEDCVCRGEPVYGVNTGFGKFSSVAIDDNDSKRLQRNVVVSCCTGVGDPFPVEVVRAMLLLRANSLVSGRSGVRPQVVEGLLELLNKQVHPLVPSKGSVGSSGDLAPLAHMALVLLGGGEAIYQGERLAGVEALSRASIQPVVLEAKEGLSLVNGTQAMTAVAALAVHDAQRLAETADLVGAMSAEALEAVPPAFDARLHESRPHPGQVSVAQNLRRYFEGSDLIVGAEHGRIQDAYSLRCMPQVHGASRDAVDHVRRVVEIELNSVTDNPLVFSEEGDVLSGGNFHGQPIALVMDFLGIALAELANISERRTERLVNPALSGGLPAFLVLEGGINDGFMVAQYTAAALVSENKSLAHPASVDSIPTSANQEDHVSMGTIAARQARSILENVQYVLAIEALCACQGIDLRDRAPSPAVRGACGLIREHVDFLQGDRELSPDIEHVRRMVADGALLAAGQTVVE